MKKLKAYAKTKLDLMLINNKYYSKQRKKKYREKFAFYIGKICTMEKYISNATHGQKPNPSYFTIIQSNSIDFQGT